MWPSCWIFFFFMFLVNWQCTYLQGRKLWPVVRELQTLCETNTYVRQWLRKWGKWDHAPTFTEGSKLSPLFPKTVSGLHQGSYGYWPHLLLALLFTPAVHDFNPSPSTPPLYVKTLTFARKKLRLREICDNQTFWTFWCLVLNQSLFVLYDW